jgi:hypothetical protein
MSREGTSENSEDDGDAGAAPRRQRSGVNGHGVERSVAGVRYAPHSTRQRRLLGAVRPSRADFAGVDRQETPSRRDARAL